MDMILADDALDDPDLECLAGWAHQVANTFANITCQHVVTVSPCVRIDIAASA